MQNYIQEIDDNLSRHTPVFDNGNSHKSLEEQPASPIWTNSNFLAHYLYKKDLFDPESFMGSESYELQALKFQINYLWENRCFFDEADHKLLYPQVEALLKKAVIAYDFDAFNNRVVILFRSRKRFYLLIRSSLDTGSAIFGNQLTSIYEIYSPEQLFLDVKFFCPLNRGVILLLGMGNFYMIEIGHMRRETLGRIDLNPRTAFFYTDKLRGGFGRSPNYLSSGYKSELFANNTNGHEPSVIIRVLTNSNSTNVSVSKCSSYIAFWSKLSKKFNYLNVATNEIQNLRTTHFFDSVVSSNQTPERLLLFDSCGRSRRLTVANLKIRDLCQIDIRESLITEFYQSRGLEKKTSYLGSSHELQARFFGPGDHIICTVNAFALIFINRGYEKEFLENTVFRPRYELAHIFSLREKLAVEAVG